MNINDGNLERWENITPSFNYDKNVPFFDITVPTNDNVRFGYIFSKFIGTNKPILLTGTTGKKISN